MTYKILTLIAILTVFFSFTPTDGHNKSEIFAKSEPLSEVSNISLTPDEEIIQLYGVFVENNASVPNLESFKNGMIGYYKLADKNLIDKEILTIIDFSLSSKKERMWVMDMSKNKILYHTVVSHGRNTGNEFATKFSNKKNSKQSSLGFFITGETYFGKNGLSLFIDGMEKQFNSNARERYVVIHGAKYANPSAIKNLGRLGRSYGCPALPTAISQEIIDLIKNKSVLYIYSDDKTYAKNSKMIQA
ncbi:MAG: murein L,D-transpeptidase catalytic domain family protein [Gillisia sp.]|nr:murein L,D-transpeptidase catalytic domain family protein [Gillisia sp.]